ncbi:hypothetical protein N7454_008684 [Penicillium verhagenii]|nr:hypothetical protein N7454_008684 [Penicillium verhagenii]
MTIDQVCTEYTVLVSCRTQQVKPLGAVSCEGNALIDQSGLSQATSSTSSQNEYARGPRRSVF